MKNQMMEVKLGKFGNVVIGHKTMLGLAQHIEKIGNEIREGKDLNKKKLQSYLEKDSTWEKIIEIHNRELTGCNIKENKTFNEISSTLLFNTIKDLPRFKNGLIDYPKILNTGYFDRLIKRQTRGKLINRGTWMNLVLLLDYAEWYDVSLWYEVHKTFIDGKILQYRDQGGEAFKELNIAIDSLPDRSKELKPNGNRGCYIQVSKAVRLKLEILDTLGYNKEEHDDRVQETRNKLIEFACLSIKMGTIKSYPELKSFILNFPIGE